MLAGWLAGMHACMHACMLLLRSMEAAAAAAGVLLPSEKPASASPDPCEALLLRSRSQEGGDMEGEASASPSFGVARKEKQNWPFGSLGGILIIK